MRERGEEIVRESGGEKNESKKGKRRASDEMKKVEIMRVREGRMEDGRREKERMGRIPLCIVSYGSNRCIT